MQLDQRSYSAAAIDKIVTANAHAKSGDQAKKILEKLAELSISVPTIMNLSNVIGTELYEDMQHKACMHSAGELMAEYRERPQIAAVSVDGGRIQTRLMDATRGVFQQAWNETKNACLETLTGRHFGVDPHPELPTCFRHQQYVEQMVREIKSCLQVSGLPVSTIEEADSESSPVREDIDKEDWRPKRLVRTCLSSMSNSEEFGPLVAAEAQRRGLYDALEKGFLGDGQGWNWTMQKNQFPDFEPIVDFVHPLTYLFEAAWAVAPDNHWQVFQRAATACWQGRVREVISALQQWLEKYPWMREEPPADNEPQAVVQKTLTYLENNATRMDYPSYRKRALPVTSAMVESMIKEINYRVKGTEKFWNRPARAEAILQVRAAALCDDDRLSQWIKNRPGSLFARPSTQQKLDSRLAV